MPGLTMLLVGERWPLVLWIRKEVEHFRWYIMDHTGRHREDSGDESNADYDGLTLEVSEGKNISKWLRDHSCNILAKMWLLFALVL